MSFQRKLDKLKKDPNLFIKDFCHNRKFDLEQIKNIHQTQQPKKEPIKKQRTTIEKYYPRVAISSVAGSFYKRLQTCCINMDLPFMLGAAPDKWMYGFHINKTDIITFLKILDFWFSEDKRYFIKFSNKVYDLNKVLQDKEILKQKSFDILCMEKNHESSKNKINTYFCSIVHIMLWEEIPSYSVEKIFSILEPNKYIHRLRDFTFHNMMKNHEKIDDDLNIYDIDFPIDAVFTWVDGDDTDWKIQKENYIKLSLGETLENSENLVGRAVSDERFRNRDELLYALRSIELFAPFIRNIYIVTCGHKPNWLNLNNPKIKIISHKEIYSNPNHLPTFNSSGIETQLHHIQGLSEHFIYLNDDFMFADFCTPSDFFYSNGIMKFFPSEARAYECDIDETREEYLVADKNAINLLKKDTGQKGRMIMKHAPYPCIKSYLFNLEKRFKSEFRTSASNKFRAMNDLRPIAFMQYNFGFKEGKAINSNISNRYLALYKPTIAEQFNGVMKTRQYKTICINDVGVTEDKLDATNQLTKNFLDNYFPLKSNFEI